VAYIAKRLTPVTKKGPTRDEVKRWVASLSAIGGLVRDEARKKLLANLDFAEGAVLEAARVAEPAKASDQLKALVSEVFRRRRTPQRLRADRALAVLEQIKTPEAEKALRVLAAGTPGHWLTEEAQAALGRGEKGRTEPK
jgi:hypothetical protein